MSFKKKEASDKTVKTKPPKPTKPVIKPATVDDPDSGSNPGGGPPNPKP